ncbi:hypothetical protein HA050_11695 [Iodobacter sp. HSC-16F04]|uniref:DUF2591 domain-containing protein n=1 Tax=Iodobacter violaceini TaxID=3044271 RepID=A0ABX0KSF2_9NEIS|nr:hypothetical protein [Iodobacter violacea]NHQ86781.1 hypothetical protein [Iodobacter violacea]
MHKVSEHNHLLAKATEWLPWEDIQVSDNHDDTFLALACYSSDSYGSWQDAINQGGVYEFNLETQTLGECLSLMAGARLAGKCLGYKETLEFIAKTDHSKQLMGHA